MGDWRVDEERGRCALFKSRERERERRREWWSTNAQQYSESVKLGDESNAAVQSQSIVVGP